MKILAIVDRDGLPLAVCTHAANHHEVTLLQLKFDFHMIQAKPQRPIGDRAYYGNKLDEQLRSEGIEMRSPHRMGRGRPATEDGRWLRRHRQRRIVERFLAWVQWHRRLRTPWEYYPANFLGFVQLGAVSILLERSCDRFRSSRPVSSTGDDARCPLHPAIEARRGGWLASPSCTRLVGRIGKPAAFLHGGPGGGTDPRARRFFDPKRYRIVLFDQRSCRRSRPHSPPIAANDRYAPGAGLAFEDTKRRIAASTGARERAGTDRAATRSAWLRCG